MDHFRFVTNGLSKEEWEALRHQWGRTGEELNTLKIFLNMSGKYKHSDLPDSVNFGAKTVNNEELDLAEIRCGTVASSNTPKQCIWLILRCKGVAEVQVKPALLDINIVLLDKYGTVIRKVLEDAPVAVMKTCEFRSDMYVLVAKIAEQHEWAEVEHLGRERLESGQAALVCLKDSRHQAGHLSATWKAIES